MFKIFKTTNVKDGMHLFGCLEVSFNWVMSDRSGNIGYQMSGMMPKRRKGISGLAPLPGWLSENDWQGIVSPEDLPRSYNPKEGFIVTANQDLNHLGVEKPINSPMGTYRADRITKLLSEKPKLKVKDNYDIQFDLFSNEAEIFMKVIRPLLPISEPGEILKNWDLCYDTKSQGAYLFEKIFEALFEKVFGANGYGLDVNQHLKDETGIYADFYLNFVNVLLSEKSEWFHGRTRNQIFREAIDQALKTDESMGDVPTWGSIQKMTMTNIFFAGKLPKFLGFDFGPIEIAGGRATVCQGQLMKSGGRLTSFLPSIRIVTDMGEDVLHTNIAGGVSDRRFSGLYTTDIKNWLTKKYKAIKPTP